jgi:putative transposase
LGCRRTGRSTAAPRDVPQADPAAHQAPPRRRPEGRQVERQIRRQRADFHHKTARTLIADHDVIAHERLNTADMTKSPAPKADPEQPGGFLPNGAAAKNGLETAVFLTRVGFSSSESWRARP